MGTPELTIGVNLGAIPGALQRSIQRTLDLVSLALPGQFGNIIALAYPIN